MILIITVCIFLTLSGISTGADDLCLSEECVETAALLSASLDHTVNPCDDFYQYSCGNWQRDHPKPNNLEGWSHFSKLTHDMIEYLLKHLSNSTVEKEPKYAQPLINLFKGCVDTNNRNLHQTKDFETIRSAIKQIGGFPLIESAWNETNFSIENAFIELNKLMDSKIILSFEVIKDLRNNTRSIFTISNPFIPQKTIEGIYRIPKEDEKNMYSFYDVVKAGPQQVSELLKGSVIDQTLWDTDMKQAQALDMALRKIATPINDALYVFQNYDKFIIHVKDLVQFKNIDLRKITDGILKSENIVLNDNDIIFADIEYLKNLGSVLLNASKRTIANVLGLNLGLILGKFSTTHMAQLISTPDLSVLPSQCLAYTEQILPDLIGRYYMDKASANKSFNDMQQLIASLRESFHQILEENQWMDTTTKANSIKKLNAITEHIAFPDFTSNDTQLLEDYRQFNDISESTFMSSMIKSLSNQRSMNSRVLKETVSPKGHWPPRASGVIVNAFYHPETNGIYFPAGIAQFPFYQHQRTRTLNLGAIGMVIAHELTHAFDNMGSLFDERGNLANWFSNTTRQTFTEKTQCFVNQYNQFRYDMGNNAFVNISGVRTLGENIADNGGVRIAFRALQLYKTKNSGKLQKLPGDLSTKTEEQLFFMSFANIWCSNKIPAAINNQIARDVHSIENARVIATLSNFEEFAKAFNCPAGSRMNPTQKCRLW